MDEAMDEPVSQSHFDAVPFYIGHHEQSRKVVVTEEVFHHAEDLGYDFLTVPITNDLYRSRIHRELQERHTACNNDTRRPYPQLHPLQAHETNISPSEISSRLLYVVNDWIALASRDPYHANVAKQVLLQEVPYAGFCGATNVLLRAPSAANVVKPNGQISGFSDAVRQALAASPGVNISILLDPTPIPADESINAEGNADIMAALSDGVVNQRSSDTRQDDLSSWDIWHSIRTACKYDNRISVALTVPKQLPPISVLTRWLSEPLRILHLPSTSFTTNKNNVDVLTKSHQSWLSSVLRGKVSPWILLSSVGPLPGLEAAEGTDVLPIVKGASIRPTAAEINFANLSPRETSPHLMYLREHLQKRQPARSVLEKYGAGYQDWPQNPLQPLADNLDSVTYEVFEKDPVKYAWYECAVQSALKDFEAQGWPRAGNGGKAVVVAVVGAGRGPLMQRVLQASQTTGVEVDAWALEKNPAAFVHLQKRNVNEWGNRVHLVQSDMRLWTGPKSATGSPMSINILVSELLGSLADNELSPECLDGAQRHLHPTHGLSVPSNYSAFVTPVAAQELWRGIKYRAPTPMGSGKMADPMLLPYVSWLHAIDYLSTVRQDTAVRPDTPTHKTKTNDILQPDVRRLWEFQHPVPMRYLNDDASKNNHHNMRTAYHSFHVLHRGACHGIAGYFEAVLYDRDTTLARFSGKSTIAPPSARADGQHRSPVPWPSDPSNVVLSTNPLTMPTASPDMISWFPLFLPFKTPLYVPDHGEMNLSIWRKTDGRGVWYEWSAEVYNADGCKCGESGWHSSEGVPCLM